MAQSTLCVCQDILGPQNMPWCIREAGEQWRELPWVAQLVGWARGSLPSKKGKETPIRENSHLRKGSNPNVCSWEWNANLLFLGTLSSPQESRQKADG